ncbi:uncharacterized protein LOC121777051 [Salvia splendens]|uniref:uncharacterized protein LOC121777051 n=1 Tax=Salvia splendens TaxID=180675 RepID=UPI001C255692|nr:uncharacterized protein LOC121777051 [Salvia splendens]
MEMRLAEHVQDNSNNANISSMVPTTKVPRGFKKRISVRGSKRLKSWVELQPKRKKKQIIRPRMLEHKMPLPTSSSALSTSHACPERTPNHLSFTEMVPFDQTMFSADRTYFSGDASNADNRDRDY